MAERQFGIGETRLPMLHHSAAGEVVTLRIRLVGLRAADQLHHVVDLAIGEFAHHPRRRQRLINLPS